MAGLKKSNQFDVSEIFRHLRTNLEFMQLDDELRVINLTSTTKNEGKSTIAFYLAKMYATKYPKVLLLDCDLRNSSIHRIMEVSNADGLTNMLAEIKNIPSIEESKYVTHVESEKRGYQLSVITAGAKVPNPTEILASKRFKLFMEMARKEYDYIIIDCPPIGFVADAIPVSSLADGTLFVVSAEENRKKAIKMAINDLARNGVNVLGVILNKVDSSARKYGYGKGYGYGYDYGYGSSDNKK